MLAAETDLKGAAEGLLRKALERDGPDNITVVLARFDGAGLAAATPADKVGFTGYDPGRDPVSETGPTPGPVTSGQNSARPSGSGVAVVSPSSSDATEETVARGTGLGRVNEGKDEARDREHAPPPTTRRPAARRDMGFDRPARNSRSVIALFFLALFAATAGGILVLKCERNQALPGEATKP